MRTDSWKHTAKGWDITLEQAADPNPRSGCVGHQTLFVHMRCEKRDIANMSYNDLRTKGFSEAICQCDRCWNAEVEHRQASL
ncbi:hypothetical protein SPHINGOAX6_70779 [Sphingomonas sp. AX6]|nr:hypothetical protein SPHINGOAX6_70779 [Sphingomonas sp. AX6]